MAHPKCDYKYEETSSTLSHDQKHFDEGICRKRIKDNKFIYYYIKNGKEIEKNDIERINKLKIPPAWENVWIAIDKENAIQAMGVDNKNRKQYRYHELHIQEAEEQKFLRLLEFIKSIPKLEKSMKKDETLGIYSKDRVIMTMLSIVKAVHMRVGKECYAQTNKSYGISSLKKIHAKIENGKVIFRFKGKSNKRLSYSIDDHDIILHLKMLMKLQGEKLFQYIDENENIRRVTDTDLNQYIQENMGKEFTCKDFRTYAANHYFIKSVLAETQKRLPKQKNIIKKNILNALKKTAYYLRHTKAISQKSYVMKFGVDMYMNNPSYFIERKNDDPNEVLLDLLKLYKKNILKIE